MDGPQCFPWIDGIASWMLMHPMHSVEATCISVQVHHTQLLCSASYLTLPVHHWLFSVGQLIHCLCTAKMHRCMGGIFIAEGPFQSSDLQKQVWWSTKEQPYYNVYIPNDSIKKQWHIKHEFVIKRPSDIHSLFDGSEACTKCSRKFTALEALLPITHIAISKE